MGPEPTRWLLAACCALLPLVTHPAWADRYGWNEPAAPGGENERGLLRINTGFFGQAAATGGDFYFWDPGEFAAAAPLLTPSLSGEAIVLNYGTEEGSWTDQVEVPVDAAPTSLQLFAGAQRLDGLHLIRPDGRSVEENPAKTTIQAFARMRLITVEDPEPGLWRVVMEGAGGSCLTVRYRAERHRAASPGHRTVELVDVVFSEVEAGDGGQRGFGEPGPRPAATHGRCRILLSGEIHHPEAALVSAGGRVLEKVRLAPSGEELVGTCRIPDEPFRVRVRGRDPEGYLVQRVTNALVPVPVKP